MNVWRLIAHREDPESVVAWSRREGQIAMGWNPGDLKQFESPREISEAVREAHPGLSNWSSSGQQLWDFAQTMQVDDLVILSAGKSRALVMKITGDYEYHSEADGKTGGHGGQVHWRSARATTIHPDVLWQLAGAKPAPGSNVRWTLFLCENALEDKEVNRLYKGRL